MCICLSVGCSYSLPDSLPPPLHHSFSLVHSVIVYYYLCNIVLILSVMLSKCLLSSPDLIQIDLNNRTRKWKGRARFGESTPICPVHTIQRTCRLYACRLMHWTRETKMNFMPPKIKSHHINVKHPLCNKRNEKRNDTLNDDFSSGCVLHFVCALLFVIHNENPLIFTLIICFVFFNFFFRILENVCVCLLSAGVPSSFSLFVRVLFRFSQEKKWQQINSDGFFHR